MAITGLSLLSGNIFRHARNWARTGIMATPFAKNPERVCFCSICFQDRADMGVAFPLLDLGDLGSNSHLAMNSLSELGQPINSHPNLPHRAVATMKYGEWIVHAVPELFGGRKIGHKSRENNQ